MKTDKMRRKYRISPELMAVLVCPVCRGPLLPVPDPKAQSGLWCKACSLTYPIRDGIPVMLVDEARKNSGR